MQRRIAALLTLGLAGLMAGSLACSTSNASQETAIHHLATDEPLQHGPKINQAERIIDVKSGEEAVPAVRQEFEGVPDWGETREHGQVVSEAKGASHNAVNETDHRTSENGAGGQQRNGTVRQVNMPPLADGNNVVTQGQSGRPPLGGPHTPQVQPTTR